MDVIMQKIDSVLQHSRAFWLYGTSQHPQPPRNEPYLSGLLCLLHFQSWTNTFYTTLTSRTIKKQLCGPVRFHYKFIRMSPTMQIAVSIRNNSVASFARCVFYSGYWVFIWLSLIYATQLVSDTKSSRGIRCNKVPKYGDLRIAKIPTDYAWRTITGRMQWNETKRN